MPAGAGTAQAKISERHVHEVRMSGGDAIGLELDVVDEDVGNPQQLVELRSPVVRRHVEPLDALIGVAVPVRQRVVEVARLDTDDVRTKIGEDAPAKRAAQVGEVDDL
jgi:hypothetical protein